MFQLVLENYHDNIMFMSSDTAGFHWIFTHEWCWGTDTHIATSWTNIISKTRCVLFSWLLSGLISILMMMMENQCLYYVCSLRTSYTCNNAIELVYLGICGNYT